jgi:hypothetical protein
MNGDRGFVRQIDDDGKRVTVELIRALWFKSIRKPTRILVWVTP